MEQRLTDLLGLATREVFETMSFMDVVREAPVDKSADLQRLEVSASICLIGEISGVLALHCTRSFIHRYVEMIIGQKVDLNDEDCCDAAGS